MSLFCVGVKISSNEGMVLHRFSNWLQCLLTIKKTEERATNDKGKQIRYEHKYDYVLGIYKPLFGCIACMSSVWGTIAFLGLNYHHITVDLIPVGILSIVCCSFLNLFIYDLSEKIQGNG